MKCPCCGAVELIHDTRDMPYIYRGRSHHHPSGDGRFLPGLRRGRSEPRARRPLQQGKLLGQFQRQVNAAYVDPDYIAKVRKKLDLDQRQAAEIFGGGVNAVLTLRERQDQAALGSGEVAQGT